MNIYRILKNFSRIKSWRLKLAGLLAFHVTGRRYIGVFLDPVMACNLRCRMCYMSDPDKVHRALPQQGKISRDTLDYIAETFFPYAVKLQIGCATEPTLYPQLPDIVRKARQHGVPYISITTNGQLLSESLLRDMLSNGLDEVTLSVHGLDKPTYEDMMRGGKFEKFLQLINTLKAVKPDFPRLQVRVNFVMNADNTSSLRRLYEVFDGLHIDILQLRPIQNMGKTSYDNFSTDKILELYDSVVAPIKERCKKDGTICLCPTKDQISLLDKEEKTKFDPLVDYLETLTYYYISHNGVNKEDFHWGEENFRQYHSRKHTAGNLLKMIWNPKYKSFDTHSTRKLNYDIS